MGLHKSPQQWVLKSFYVGDHVEVLVGWNTHRAMEALCPFSVPRAMHLFIWLFLYNKQI